MKINLKKFIPTVIVVFIVANILGFFIHGILLKADYLPIAGYYRPRGEEKVLFASLAYLAFAIGSVWVYAMGVEDKNWIGQGIRFGIAIWLVLAVPSFLIAYAVQPVPGMLAAKQVLFEGVDKVVLGILTAALYRR
ncbi:MAG TPA: hypothetical protein VGC61_06240 [Pyrinomonadaceae bacterium]|jgi:hypothetical protein